MTILTRKQGKDYVGFGVQTCVPAPISYSVFVHLIQGSHRMTCILVSRFVLNLRDVHDPLDTEFSSNSLFRNSPISFSLTRILGTAGEPLDDGDETDGPAEQPLYAPFSASFGTVLICDRLEV